MGGGSNLWFSRGGKATFVGVTTSGFLADKIAGEFSLVCATHHLKKLLDSLPGVWSVSQLSQYA